MNAKIKKAKEKLINAGYRLDGEEEVLIDDVKSIKKFLNERRNINYLNLAILTEYIK